MTAPRRPEVREALKKDGMKPLKIKDALTSAVSGHHLENQPHE